MTVVIRYNPTNLTQEQYGKINDFFMQEGMPPEPPQALKMHVLFGDEGKLQVSEIWESEESWRESYDGGVLGQALDSAGVERDPQVLEAHSFWGTNVPAPPAPPS